MVWPHGSATVVNGTAAGHSRILDGGTHQVGVLYEHIPDQTLSASTTLTVNKATPVLTWATPAAIYTSTPLSGTQLNATAAGVTNVALPGTFVYNPAAGTTADCGPARCLARPLRRPILPITAPTPRRVSIQVNTPTRRPSRFRTPPIQSPTDRRKHSPLSSREPTGSHSTAGPQLLRSTASRSAHRGSEWHRLCVAFVDLKAGNHQVAVSTQAGPKHSRSTAPPRSP